MYKVLWKDKNINVSWEELALRVKDAVLGRGAILELDIEG